MLSSCSCSVYFVFKSSDQIIKMLKNKLLWNPLNQKRRKVKVRFENFKSTALNPAKTHALRTSPIISLKYFVHGA